jgi:hypothetical protein
MYATRINVRISATLSDSLSQSDAFAPRDFAQILHIIKKGGYKPPTIGSHARHQFFVRKLETRMKHPDQYCYSPSVTIESLLEQFRLDAAVPISDGDQLTTDGRKFIIVRIEDIDLLICTNGVNIKCSVNLILNQMNIGGKIWFIQILRIDILIEDVALKEALLFRGK